SLRLAGRDLARHGVRVAAATAAVALTLTGAVTISTYQRANLPSDGDAIRSLDRFRAADAPGVSLDEGPERLGQLIARKSRLVDGRVLPLTVDDRTTAALEDVTHTVGTVTRHPA